MAKLFFKKIPFLSIEWNSIRLGGPAHGIVTKSVHKTLPGDGGGPGGGGQWGSRGWWGPKRGVVGIQGMVGVQGWEGGRGPWGCGRWCGPGPHPSQLPL